MGRDRGVWIGQSALDPGFNLLWTKGFDVYGYVYLKHTDAVSGQAEFRWHVPSGTMYRDATTGNMNHLHFMW
jgi:hypothetical protein